MLSLFRCYTCLESENELSKINTASARIIGRIVMFIFHLVKIMCVFLLTVYRMRVLSYFIIRIIKHASR